MAAAERDDEPDRRGAKAADRERESTGRRVVQPLDVVDGDHERAGGGKTAERGEDRPADEQRIGRSVGFAQLEGRRESTRLRLGEGQQRRFDGTAQQVAETGIPQAELGLDRPCDEDADAAIAWPQPWPPSRRRSYRSPPHPR